MDNQENPNLQDLPKDKNWLDEILAAPELGEEILPDETAIASAGLTHPNDLEVDRIIQETLAQMQEDGADLEDIPQELSSLPPEEAPLSQENQDTGLDDLEVVQLIQQTLAEMENNTPPAPAAPAENFKDAEYRDAYEDETELEAAFGAIPAPSEEEPEEELPEDEQPEKPTPQPPARKRRPRRKGKDNLFGLPHILSTVVWLAVILAIGVSLGNFLWVCASDVLAFGREDHQVTVTIDNSDTITDIANKLEKAGLIRYPNLFTLYSRFTNAREDINAGTYTLNTMYDYHALVSFMNSGSAQREIVEVVIPEGYNCAQIFALLEEKQVVTVADMEAYAAEGELDEYWFLEDVERGDRYCLEGFLFPDTYEFYVEDEPRRVLEKMLDDFDYRFTDKMRSSLITLNQRLSEWMADNGHDQEYIDQHQISLRELIIVASLIEEETANTLESYTISSVIYNRLYNWGDTPAYLNIDAAILYALGEHKEHLSAADLQIDSPYNTYTNIGLTPGPITNPGLYSINAALDPDNTDYFYYAMDPSTGEHHFSTNEEDHNDFLASLVEDEEAE